MGLDDTTNEVIDALDLLSDGRILISTIGSFTVPGLTGNDEDLLAFTPTTLGETTSGTWAMYFDGSLAALGLGNSAEDVDGLEIAASGDIYLTTGDVFAVTGISGDDEDIFVCTPSYTGSAVTSCTYSSTLYFDGSAYNLAANDVDAINLPLELALNSSTLALHSPLPLGEGRVRAHFASYQLAPPPQTGPTTFTPVADAYVAGDATTTNYGTSTTLRADDSPLLNSYLRFDVQGLSGNVTSATLRIYANSASTVGYTVYGVSDNSWTESTINYSNAPVWGDALNTSGSFSAATWTSVDVTDYITGDGTYSFAFNTASSTNISFSSREGGNPPQLVIETSSGPTYTPTATSTPSQTATAGPSATPTNTSVATPTKTATPAVTNTPSRTPTAAGSNTPTVPPTTPPPAFQSAKFDYDGDGKRVKSTFNGTITTYFAGAHYEVSEGSGSTITKYYYAGAHRIAMRTNGELNYLLGDHLGSTSLTTDAAGNKVSELHYKAWGEVRYASGNVPTKYQYTGQYSYESEFGLYFYNARWYDSALGRFNQPDTIVPEQTQGVQAWDRYAYTNNNPLRYNDPSGHCPICLTAVIGAAIGGMVGAVGYTAYAAATGREFNSTHFWIATGGGAAAGALIGSVAGIAAGVGVAEATTAAVGAGGAANTACGGDMCASEVQDLQTNVTTLHRFADSVDDLASRASTLSEPMRTRIANQVASMSPAELVERAEQHAMGLVENSPIISTLKDPAAGAATTDPWLRSIVTGAQNLYTLSVPNNLIYYPQNALSKMETEILVLADTLAPYVTKVIENPYLIVK